jgi:hypothetical protein
VKRYWFEFVVDPQEWRSPGSVLRAGCGVTGWDREDCLALIRTHVLKGDPLPPIGREVEDVDVSTLDQGHVTPNMLSIFPRGIWFPQGFQLVRD